MKNSFEGARRGILKIVDNMSLLDRKASEIRWVGRFTVEKGKTKTWKEESIPTVE